ncbi:MAG: hypothetical protein Q4C53_01195 [Clostridia bacterium]|nr:hypothetical protein [Clostridia bacterium]
MTAKFFLYDNEAAPAAPAEAPAAVTEVATGAEAAAADAAAVAQTGTETAAATETTTPVVTPAGNIFSGGFFSLIMLAMSVYVLIGGITGKGKLFAIENIKEGKEEQAKKTLRIIYAVTGLFMALNTAVGYLRDKMYGYSVEAQAFVRTDFLPNVNIGYKVLNVTSLVMLVITMAGVVAMFVSVNKFVDKNAARQQQGKGSSGGNAPGSIFPKGAFDFDEEDK